MGVIYNCKPIVNHYATSNKASVEFFGLGNDDAYLVDAICDLAFFEEPERAWADVLAQYTKSPPKLEAIQTQLFKGGLTFPKKHLTHY